MGGYPSTNIELVNNSIKTVVPVISSTRQKAILLTACASDKGYEEFKLIDKDFTKIYGDLSFAKYGQAQIQTEAIISAGAEAMHRRIVSKKSKLAHIGLNVTVTKTEKQKVDVNGAPLYVDAAGVETTAADGNTAVMITGVSLKYGTSKLDGDPLLQAANRPKVIAKAIKDTFTDWATADLTTSASITFPIAVFTETGRGKSKKKIRVVPDYASSKSSSWTKYNLEVIEDNESVDNVLIFSMNSVILDEQTKENRFLDSVIAARSMQLRCVAFEDSTNRLFEYIATILKLDVEALKRDDILFACTRKGYPLDNITIDPEGVKIGNAMGIDLLNGDNGDLGDYPLESTEYDSLLVETFNGKFSPDIYDINNNRVNAIFDANYPPEVKRAIEGLVSFREDIFYFRDLGLELYTIEDILGTELKSLKNCFCASYHNSYDIFEPITRKQVTVTCMYDLAQKFVLHEAAGISRPFAGILYGITFTDEHIIEDTINFIPKKIPGYDQIASLADAKINYIVKYNGIPTMDTEYTSDESDSDFSYINNILAIQDLVRLIRERCPKTRYTFKDGDDYESYKKDVNAILSTRQGNFSSMKLEFLSDEAQRDSKAVYASIEVGCRNFIEKEYFKIIAINN